MNLSEYLAKKVTKRLFEELGSDFTPCQRIEFKGGVYPDNEIAQGGLGKKEFQRVVEKCLACALINLKP